MQQNASIQRSHPPACPGDPLSGWAGSFVEWRGASGPVDAPDKPGHDGDKASYRMENVFWGMDI